jgi:hypothetical protein
LVENTCKALVDAWKGGWARSVWWAAVDPEPEYLMNRL